MATVNSTSNALAAEKSTTQFSPHTVLTALGSLRITVALFAASLIIVLVGTLAQDELNMQAVKARYFLTWIALVRIDDFFPQAFYNHSSPIPGVIPFPGGSLIGLLLMVNLIAAKATRFKINASGSRLLAGTIFIIAGIVVAGLIVASGHSSDGLQGAPPISYIALWRCMQAIAIASGFGLVAWSMGLKHKGLRVLGYVVAAIILGVICYTLITGGRIGDPGMRIVWQLAKGLLAGLILLVGCNLLFGKQGGNMLLHLGVGLLMVGQFAFGDRQLEQRINLIEGESTNTLVNLDKVELNFIVSSESEDKVIAVPSEKLVAAKRSGQAISDDALPVDIKVLDYFKNSQLRRAPKENNPATAGMGLQYVAVDVRQRGGAESEQNMASAYIELLDKESGEPLGTHLVSQYLSDSRLIDPIKFPIDDFDEVTVGETTYKLGMKYGREVKPYWVHLEDVQRRNYSGTETPRDYSSYVRIIDPETGEDRRERVWMNNPLRYRGETFFQSSYIPLAGGKEMTGLQVVRNSGWLIPYVACSIMALGMLAHFTGVLKRFVGRRERERVKQMAGLSSEQQLRLKSSKPIIWASLIAGLFAVVMLVPRQEISNRMRPANRDQSYDFYTAGKIPIQFGGRTMPLDSYARFTLKAISTRESLPVENAPDAIKERVNGSKMSAMQWLMEVASNTDEHAEMPMFRIDAEEVRSQLSLPRRQSKLYSLREVLENWQAAMKLVTNARAKDAAELSFKERELLELDQRTREYTRVAETFQLPSIRSTDSDGMPEDLPPELRERFRLMNLFQRMKRLEDMSVARIIPPTDAEIAASVNDPKWKPFASAFFMELMSEPDESQTATAAFSQMIDTYSDNKADYATFNEAVDAQLALSKQEPIPGLNIRKIAVERWMQNNSPRWIAFIFYVVALILAVGFFAFGNHGLRNATWGILLITFLVHSITLCCRIYITGRAPVINLHSSAVFIGWAAVLGGLVIDRIFRLGFGNMMAAKAGALSSLVAYSLDKNDTMPVLEAVLDTQFWLTTHVISVAMGYVATMVAGLLGVLYLFSTWFGKDDKAKDVYRMTYGATCFGILFSTIGTILGGLWADDSWGRFWGWDPKENGALLIVIWNALMLHARWDGMVKGLGFSVLAIAGNIITAWSWFGTNELGIGLHAYGFTKGVMFWFGCFVASQILFIAAGIVTGSIRKAKPTA
ncbi:cytochrome c biogenesis protein CcsA [Stieleria sp. JC731]|uniref:cytochrome c biogenesis protein n=1 Tax=Pirellulaceae TaxID=2691357 RepID=UPI001E5AC76A|nr:cytochrome c biogenesis protein CcsA [Stieleria sp. JC731]MCC9599704.1 cytochrome c biogenesis protein CcsA [Stieleria sp. JC731]